LPISELNAMKSTHADWIKDYEMEERRQVSH
jgi:hypothetical protein